MRSRRILAAAVAGLLALGSIPALAQQAAQVATGVISGRATDEAKQPYSDYAVQLRDAATGRVVSAQPLNAQGQFAFSSVELSRRYLVELMNTRENKLVCTEGPYFLSSPTMVSKTDVNVDCGKAPAALWLLVAGAGTAGAIAIVTRSVSQ